MHHLNKKNFVLIKRVGISLEFMLPCLLSTTSFLMSDSRIQASIDHYETSVMYTALIANPSTGKSTSIKLIRRSLREIEMFDEIEEDDSKLVNGN